MRGLNSETVDLIYLDPPFNSKKNYAAPLGSQAEGATFDDTWSLDDIKEEWAHEIEILSPELWHAVVGAGHTAGDSMQAYLTIMAVRLLEMKRLLKDTGSIYLHCDPHASHYLKQLMDAVFGPTNFVNELLWCYATGGASKKRFSRKHDVILFFARDEQNRKFNTQRQPYTSAMSQDPKHAHKFNPEGRIMTDWWTDIDAINPQAKERTGYPTQKPLALLERIIKASSNKGDMVLDPFCGCATTCVAAESLGRKWVGIDIEEKARDLVVERLVDAADKNPLLKDPWGTDYPPVNHRSDTPERTDPDKPTRSGNIKEHLFREQQERCGLPCEDAQVGRKFRMRDFHVDHIIPRAKNGPDVDDNLQLLCPSCNSIKSTRTQTEAREIIIKMVTEELAEEAERAAANERAKTQNQLDLE